MPVGICLTMCLLINVNRLVQQRDARHTKEERQLVICVTPSSSIVVPYDLLDKAVIGVKPGKSVLYVAPDAFLDRNTQELASKRFPHKKQ